MSLAELALTRRRFLAASTRISICSNDRLRCRFYDYDNDGWLDIFSGEWLAAGRLSVRRRAYPHLFRNNRDGTFTDVTAKAGVGHSGGARAFASETTTMTAGRICS